MDRNGDQAEGTGSLFQEQVKDAGAFLPVTTDKVQERSALSIFKAFVIQPTQPS